MPKFPRCTVCGAPLKQSPERKGRAFCSERCRMVDLGKWLGGEYKIPGPPADELDVAEELRRRVTESPADGDEDDG